MAGVFCRVVDKMANESWQALSNASEIVLAVDRIPGNESLMNIT